MKPQIKAKQNIVQEIVDLFTDAKGIVFVDYKGINVEQDTQLRRKFREQEVVYKVYKNRLLKRALEQMGITEYNPEYLEGTTSVAVSSDEVIGAKILADAIKEYKKMDFKFGIIDGEVFDKEKVVQLSKLPTKDVLIVMLLRMLQAPVSGLARALNEIAKKEEQS